jgi:tetratricopeptide (TPR) repeat protein
LSSWLSRDPVWGLILFFAVVLAYSPVWWAGYFWDDVALVTANPCIVGPLGFKEIWTTSAADICPLTITTFWVEHTLWGLAPLPYHLVNVFMHGACAILLWRVLRPLQVPGAWLGAALWALHPVQVESVAWITEMKNTESGLFFLLSIFFFVRWLRARDIDGRVQVNRSYGLTLLFAALAMASKSSTVILPGVLCLCAWWMEGRWQWRNVARATLIFLMSIAACALSIWTQGLQLKGAADPQWVRTWPQRFVTAGDAVWFYLGKLVWPHPLICIYPRWEIDAGHWVSYLPLLAVISVLFIFWFNRGSWSRPWFFIFAYFLVALLPVLGLVDNLIFRYSLVFDHFQYLASMGPLVLAGAGMIRLADFAIPSKPWLQRTLGTGMLLILGILNWQRACAFESEERLWTDTLSKNPNCWIGYNNLGDALYEKGQLDEALVQYHKALEIDPNYADVHYNLGTDLLAKGQVDAAMVEFQKALEINPNFANAHNNLGNVLLQKGQVDDAIDEFQKALEINPIYADARFSLGNGLMLKKRVDEAITQYQKALEINPGYAKARNNLGMAFLQKGQPDEAIAQFQEALHLNPNDPNAQANLAKAQAMAQQATGSK